MITYYLAWHPEENILACFKEEYDGGSTTVISLDTEWEVKDGTVFWPIPFLAQTFSWQILGILGTEAIKVSKQNQGR